ncbi:MAG: type A chloramphenicol O-acetyltransferase, partial [Clostridia bacterium]|nr:type A chloramphenicol O-acetyltransferase [Clostridia bacterium]
YLPLAIQAHHAVCDGYHIGMFVERLQEYVNNFEKAAEET